MSVGKLFFGISVALGTGLIGVASSAAQAQDPPPPPVTVMRTMPVLVRAAPEPSPEPTETPAPVTISGRPVPEAPSSETPPRPAPATPVQRTLGNLLTILKPLVERPAVTRQTEITPPAAVPNRAIPGAITLRAGPNSTTMRSLHVVQRYPLAQIRAKPTISLGGTQLNLRPVLDNPRALPNIAQRLRAAPELAEVVADDTSITRVDQGLIIRSFMTYRIKPGTCTDAVRRTALTRTGISCATYLPQSARAAAFANPRDPHYVADPAQRASALAMANEKGAISDAELDKQVASIRGDLADPAKRGTFDTARGAGAADRLDAMSDEEIKSEIVNSGETSLEQTLFVPNLSRVDPKFQARYGAAGAPASPPPPVVKPDVDASAPIGQHIYLTGFTLGKDYEWSQRIEKTIKLCLVGCSHTYYAEVRAGFNYGFGLRFPIQVGGTYAYHRSGKNPADETATLTTTFVPINGSAQQYAEAGLEAGKIFEGKEFVAQFGGHAGAGYDLPFMPSQNVDIAINFDFTKELTGDFYNGQFTPPVPGSGTGPQMKKIFTDIDLTGGVANFGVLGAKVFPAIDLTLISDSLTFTVHDSVRGAGSQDTVITSSGQKVNLAVRPQDHSSQFSIGEPKYTLSFLVTPGIDARLFVDIAVWSHNWDFEVWFPQLAIKVPSDGLTFGCHAGTACMRNYVYTPISQTELAPTFQPKLASTEPGFDTDIHKWGKGFDDRYMSECADETCRFGIKFIRQGYIYGALHKYDANTALKVTDKVVVDYLKGAQGDANNMINESQARQTNSAVKSFGTFWIIWWSKQCSDKICLDKVKGITFFAQLEAISLQKQNPDWSTGEVIGAAGKKFAKVFEAEIKASKARVAAEEAAQKEREAKQLIFTPVKLHSQN